ncbi:hypothetical protein CTKA_01680 [Chthonomonas calidirosea]|uniref:Antitoxin SocA-like Panacea domain-containing protein n=1 Tax=Chthonomonas calidirosea (strain DSM 23976 / ICMP 18418 / T49) TaxID=1303518 RepID=S0EZZ3_CHTCT|nr:type II toxin-antitoxin system antitoxin SocA domain-containing protein [Chthonomonas calidirosea]CCW36218.1 hypothetical protein CCALI_02414 [Chthonomonas calidirosea T49]CEK17986.1 hypothetical protein CTKA_01680 [Chthonomonas calidirosea]
MDTTERKNQELVLYITLRSETDAYFGLVKRYKLLFFADRLALRKLGRPLSGFEYRKMEFVPVPEGIDSTIETLQTQQDIVVAKRPFYGYTQKKPLALREPRLDEFTADEITRSANLRSNFCADNFFS